MGNASSFWPTATNGDGNGRVGLFPDLSIEKTAFWQDIAFAGLIEGSYTVAVGRNMQPGINVMQSRLARAGWTALYFDGYTDINDFAPPRGTTIHGHVLMFGSETIPGGCCETYDSVITAPEAWNIDTKIDDGLIINGRVQGSGGSDFYSNCATSQNSTIATYNLMASSISCGLYFIAPF
jgi:hypothetical protein